MRFLLVGFAIVVFLLLAAAGIGLLLPKRHTASRIASFRATPEQLFSLIVVLRCEAVSPADGRELVRETTRGGETITYELLDQIPPASLKRRITTENLPYSGTWTYSLETKGGITILRIIEDGEVYNPVFRFMSRFVLGHTRTMDAYLHALGKATGQDVDVTD